MTTDNKYLEQFQQVGYVVLERLIDLQTIETWKDSFHQLIQKVKPIQRPSKHGLGRQIVVDNLVEYEPGIMLSAVANSMILDFLELLMGPFVQLESLRINLTEPVAVEQVEVDTRNWHRDMWAIFAGCTSDYLPPNACNVLTYFQDMDDQIGPLRILPGSHRTQDLIQNQFQAQTNERFIYAQAGDIVVIHSALIHAASPNISDHPRYFMSRFYNKSYLPHRDHHTGPNVQHIIEVARQRKDRRLMRLFGIDDLVFSRQVDVTVPETKLWQMWIQEDKDAKENRS